MEENYMYFCKDEIYEKIRSIGGQWGDQKTRPIVCLIESVEQEGLYWAIPVGNWNHRNEEGKQRIMDFMAKDISNIESCYYHVGRTTVKSIFFISDAFPITAKYIDRNYLGFDKLAYKIKNKKLLSELEDKLKRILAYEEVNKNHFRQHITDIKVTLIEELKKAK